jgi:hypothetical protein
MTQRQVVAGPAAGASPYRRNDIDVGADSGEAPVTVAHYLGSPRS